MKHRLTVMVWMGVFLPVWTATTATTATTADGRLQIELAPGNSLELLLVQPGSLAMGSPVAEEGRNEDETLRSVTLSQAFYLGRTEVSVRQFEAFVRETRHRTEAEDGKSGGYGWDGTKLVQAPRYTWRSPGYVQTPDHPVTLVTWNDAKRFCAWLSGKAKRTVTLPSEAQWEYACRAGESSGWSGGSAEEVAWTVENAAGQAHPVAGRKPNAWGFHDLHGNVWEWCEDWYGPYEPTQAVDPLQIRPNLSDRPRRVLRGGSWLKEVRLSRSASRFRNDARSRNPDNGFRVMCLATEPAPPRADANPASTQTAIDGNNSVQNSLPKSNSAAAVVDGAASPGAGAPAPAMARSVRPAAATGPSGRVAAPVFHEVGQRTGFQWRQLISWVLFGTVGVFLLALARKVLFSGSGSVGSAGFEEPGIGAAPVRPRLFQISPQPDGFWILARVAAGSRMQWSCLAGGRVHEGEIDYQPGPQGQFVFTGSLPSEIKVRTLGSGGPLDVASNDLGGIPTTDDPNLLGRAAMLYEINDSIRRSRDSANPPGGFRRRRNPSAY